MRISSVASTVVAIFLFANEASAQGADASAEPASPDSRAAPTKGNVEPARAVGSAPAVESKSAPEAAREDSGATRSVAYAALGVSAAGLAVGVVGGLQVLSAKSTVDSHCAGVTRTCDQEGLDAAARGSTWSIVSPIGFGVAALGLGAFAYLWIRSADRAPAKSALVLSPSASPAGGGFVLGGTL